jgi:hypothetical protein
VLLFSRTLCASVLFLDNNNFEVAFPVNKYKQIGIYKVTFDARLILSGIYFYKIYGGYFEKTKKILLL